MKTAESGDRVKGCDGYLTIPLTAKIIVSIPLEANSLFLATQTQSFVLSPRRKSTFLVSDRKYRRSFQVTQEGRCHEQSGMILGREACPQTARDMVFAHLIRYREMAILTSANREATCYAKLPNPSYLNLSVECPGVKTKSAPSQN